jgi:hypothetical protein
MHADIISKGIAPWTVVMFGVVYVGALVSSVFMTKRKLMLLGRARAPTEDRLDKT